MQDFINTFHIDWKLMIAQIINFGLVFAAFYFLASKPLSKLVKDRTGEIETGLSNAKENAVLLEKTKKEYEEVLAKARIESNNIYKDGQKDLERLKAETMEKIKADTDEWQKNRVKQIEIDKKILVDSAKNEIIKLAMLSAEKILDDKNKQNK